MTGLTLERLNEAMRLLEQPKEPILTGRIIPSRFHPKHPTRTFRVIYSGHPWVTKLCWVIRRWVWIRPWVVAEYADDADPIYFRGDMICGLRHYELLRRAFPCRPERY